MTCHTNGKPQRKGLQALVEEFHRASDSPIGDYAAPAPLGARRELREALLAEECGEALEASLGQAHYLEPLVKELADVLYVIYGYAVELGVDLDEVFREVHASNMSKLAAGAVRRPDGKILKSPHYKQPDIGGVLLKQVQEASQPSPQRRCRCPKGVC